MNPADPLHSVHTVCEEAKTLAARHPELPDAAQGAGMLAWGLLRAVAECPECPGVFRCPTDTAWTHLDCPHCGGRWTYHPKAPGSTPPRKRQARRTP